MQPVLPGELPHAGHPRRRGGLTEDAFETGDVALRGEDLFVTHRLDRAARFITRGRSARPGRGVADPDRGGGRLRLRHRLAAHDGSRALGLESEPAGRATTNRALRSPR